LHGHSVALGAGKHRKAATIQQVQSAIYKLQGAFSMERVRALDAIFKGKDLVFNPKTVDFVRYYQEKATAVITKYQGMIRQTNDPTKIANYERDIATQNMRLKQIADWLEKNGQKAYPIQPPIGPEGFPIKLPD
jgi:hypothetical protein